MPSCVLCGIFIQTTEFDIPCSHSSEEISSDVNGPSRNFNNAQRKLLSLKTLLRHFDHQVKILKAFNKEKAIVRAFYMHFETSGRFVDSST